MRPVVFLDFDDVICLGQPYGGSDVFRATEFCPADLWKRLWHRPAIDTLLTIVDVHRPMFVITTSWLRVMEREAFVDVFRKTGLDAVADSLHQAWEAPTLLRQTRLDAVCKWLRGNHRGEPFVVLDDHVSGTGLRGSNLDKQGRVVLCAPDVGLHAGHLNLVRQALAK